MKFKFRQIFFFFFLPSWDTVRGYSMCELTVLQITVLNSSHSPSRGKIQGLRELCGLVPGQVTAQRLAPSSPSPRPARPGLGTLAAWSLEMRWVTRSPQTQSAVVRLYMRQVPHQWQSNQLQIEEVK